MFWNFPDLEYYKKIRKTLWSTDIRFFEKSCLFDFRINDGDDYVRQTSIIVLSYLVLNDMVKVRGTVADLAQCVNDENANVGQLAKFFFSELAKKV